ncbi:Hpt domain-containing protein [bacterium]|nr:Hpt domain-containing protein [bacterium]
MSEITRESVLKSIEDAAERMGLDLEDLQEMINEVLEDCTAKAHRLKEAIASKDATTVKTIAHDIKGSCANYGLLTASEIAFTIEKNPENSSVETADELCSQFEAFSKLDLDKTI